MLNRQIIENYLKEHSITKKELCRQLGYSERVLERLIKGERTVKATTRVRKLAIVLSVKPNDLFMN